MAVTKAPAKENISTSAPICRARMHVHLDRRPRAASPGQVPGVRLPAARECHYHITLIRREAPRRHPRHRRRSSTDKNFCASPRSNWTPGRNGKARQRSRRGSACPRPTARREHEERPESRNGIHNPETRSPGRPGPRRGIPTEWPCGRLYGLLRRFEVSNYPERLKGRLTGVLERSPGRLARAPMPQPDTNLETEIHPKKRRAGPAVGMAPALRRSKTQKEQENA